MTRAALIALTAIAPAAVADLVDGPIVAPYDARVSVGFVSQSAGWIGELSWIGTLDSPESPTFIMNNRASPDDPAIPIAEVQQGDILFFQYEIVTGTLNTYRQDDFDGALQFKHQWISNDTAQLHIEDIELPGGDQDFNDAVYAVTFTPIPAPGSTALFCTGLALLVQRRRQGT